MTLNLNKFCFCFCGVYFVVIVCSFFVCRVFMAIRKSSVFWRFFNLNFVMNGSFFLVFKMSLTEQKLCLYCWFHSIRSKNLNCGEFMPEDDFNMTETLKNRSISCDLRGYYSKRNVTILEKNRKILRKVNFNRINCFTVMFWWKLTNCNSYQNFNFQN